jgi:membrane protein implicated in regulation of membrane protease activity
VVALFWEALRWRILLILFALYALLAMWLLRCALRIVNEGQVGLPVTMAELQKDRAALMGDDGSGDTQ